ncbi:MAG: hypothetical protein JXA21_25210 [Anaerolineae bacterium]|nr:hypothetical protein [Anaerolineae bacterium]
MDTLDEVIQLFAAGERDRARTMVVRILQSDLQNVTAWRLLASLLDDPAQKMDCYRRIIAIAPDNQEAKEKLQQKEFTAQALPTQNQSPAVEMPLPPRETDDDILPPPPPIPPPPALPASSNAYTTTQPMQAPAKGDFLRRMLVAAVGTRAAKLLGVQSPEADQKNAANLEAITPDEIIKMAGGPLPPEERRQCPKCQATISVRARRCEWCGTPLEGESGAGNGE